MSNIGKFQLPPIKGTEVFPATMQSPPIVRATVKFTTDPREPYNPEVLSDYVKDVLSEHSARLGHFVQTQRQNYNAGVVEFAKTKRSFPEFEVSYSNNQNRHEIVYVTLNVDIHRTGGKLKKLDQMMLLVLHDGSKLSAIPMSALGTGNFDIAYRHECRGSFWGNDFFRVNQLRLGEKYSVIASELSLAEKQIVYTGGSAIIATDSFENSLQAYCDLQRGEVTPMNGSGDKIYLPDTTLTYDPLNDTLSASGGDSGDAVSKSGEWSEYDWRTSSGSVETQYVNSVAQSGGAVTVRPVNTVYSYTSVRYGYELTHINFVSTDTGASCGVINTVTATPETISRYDTARPVSSATFDGISLGSISWGNKTETETFGSGYIITQVDTYGPFPVTGQHPTTGQIGGGQGDGQFFGPIWTGGGSVTRQYTSADPIDSSETFGPPDFKFDLWDVGMCGIFVSAFDYAAGGPWNISSASVDAAVARIAAEHAGDCVTCNATSRTRSASGGFTNTISRTTLESSGDIGSGNVIGFPYAVDDRIYYTIYRGQSSTVYSPYGQTGEYFRGGFWNVSNGEHLIQSFWFNDTELFVMLDERDIASDLATACRTSIGALNAVFMDIPLSKIVEFD